MTIIVGLGNPGKKYEKTRHNVGFWVIDELAKQKTRKFIIAKPQTFMNNSGKAVKAMLDFYKAKPENLWVIHDDIDLLLGEFKISKGQGSAGHKGVQSIIKELSSKDFTRLRVGIQPRFQQGKPRNVERFVLQKFDKKEEMIIKQAIKKSLANYLAKL